MYEICLFDFDFMSCVSVGLGKVRFICWIIVVCKFACVLYSMITILVFCNFYETRRVFSLWRRLEGCFVDIENFLWWKLETDSLTAESCTIDWWGWLIGSILKYILANTIVFQCIMKIFYFFLNLFSHFFFNKNRLLFVRLLFRCLFHTFYYLFNIFSKKKVNECLEYLEY